jgi:TolB protein
VTDNVKKLFFIFITLLASQAAHAQLEIEIISGNASALPIAIVPFEWQEAGPPPVAPVHDIISGDLYRSGLFDPMAVEDMAERPVEAEAIRFGTWRLLKVDYIVVSSCSHGSPPSGRATCDSAHTGWRTPSTKH